MSLNRHSGFWRWSAVIFGGVVLAHALLALAPAVEILPFLFLTWSVAALYYLMPHAFRRRRWGWDFIPLMGSSGWLLENQAQEHAGNKRREMSNRLHNVINSGVMVGSIVAAILLATMSDEAQSTRHFLLLCLVIGLAVLVPFYRVRNANRSNRSAVPPLFSRPGTKGWLLEHQRWEQAEAQQREIEAQRQAVAQVAANVDRAVARAENHLAATPFWLEDIGLLLYNDTQTPTISREEAVCAAGAHLRPYVILNCPYSMGDTKLAVSFSLWDDQDQLVYAAQVRQPLSDGATLLTPQTWVRIPDDQPAGKWSLRVSIKGYGLLAVHEFKWWRGDQELHFTSDGEIDPRIVELLMQRLAEPVEDESISLDELLAQQKNSPV